MKMREKEDKWDCFEEVEKEKEWRWKKRKEK